MLYIDSIWEYIVNFLELALFIIFIHKKLRIRANYKHQAVLMFLFVSFQFAVLCTLNKKENIILQHFDVILCFGHWICSIVLS